MGYFFSNIQEATAYDGKAWWGLHDMIAHEGRETIVKSDVNRDNRFKDQHQLLLWEIDNNADSAAYLS